ncbi:hypothetical protein [Mucilaginibacter sp.]|uniref:DoxX family protein n=1 Tax=Mucilaginibacter sp. TaxID=1882438 RepID=UPI0032646F86
MKPLVVLLVVFGLTCLVQYFSFGAINYPFCGLLAMAVMLVFTSIAHFKFVKGMAMMLPAGVPFKIGVVYLTGVLELAAATGLMIAQTQHLTAILLIVFFVLLLPANIYAAANKIDLEKATNTGNGLNYLWFRVPLQLFFIGWVCFFGLMV